MTYYVVKAKHPEAGTTVLIIAKHPTEGMCVPIHILHGNTTRHTRTWGAIFAFFTHSLIRYTNAQNDMPSRTNSQVQQRWHVVEDVDWQGGELVRRKSPGSP